MRISMVLTSTVSSRILLLSSIAFAFTINISCEGIFSGMSEIEDENPGQVTRPALPPGSSNGGSGSSSGQDPGDDEDFTPPFAGGGGGSTSPLRIQSFSTPLLKYFNNQTLTVRPNVQNVQGNISYNWSHSIAGTANGCEVEGNSTSFEYRLSCASAGSLTVTLSVRDARNTAVASSTTFTLMNGSAVNPSFQGNVVPILQQKCMSCHGSGAIQWNLGNQVQFTDGRVSSGRAESSRLITKIQGWGATGNMVTPTDGEMDTIIRWIENGF